MNRKVFFLCIIIQVIFYSCSKPDNTAPVLFLNEDTIIHYFGEPYVDAGVEIADDKSCDLDSFTITSSEVDIYHYGTYNITYEATDDAGNAGTAERKIDIVLKTSNFFSENYDAKDTCSTGNYAYTGLIQDCDCPESFITVGNISNFGPTVLFPLPVGGNYNQKIILDTTRFAITFLGDGIMSSGADTIRWNYTISDTITTDVCTSTWIKN